MSRGYCGIGIYNGKVEENLGTLWRSAFNLGADFIFTIGKRYTGQCSDTPKTYKNIPLYAYSDYSDFIKHIPYKCKVIAVELNEESRDLKNFVHPEQCVYLLGAEDYGIPQNILSKCDSVVMIDSHCCMNVSVTGAIVLYDRKIKS